MKKLRNWMCLLTVLALLGSAAACGNETESTGSDAALESTDATRDTDDDYWRYETDDGSEDDAPIDMDNLVIQGESTVDSVEDSVGESAEESRDSAESSDESTQDSAQESAGESSAAESKPADSKTESSKTDSKNDSREESSSVSSTADSKPESSVSETAAPTEAATEAVDPENVVAGVIQLNGNSITAEGTGVTVEGTKVIITGEGTYVVSGTLNDGCIEVNTTLKVKLKLNGASISCSTGPAILIEDAKRMTITLIEGTTNAVSDGASTVYDGAIFSNDTLEIKGGGTLNVTGNNAHGIASDDDIVVKNGSINIKAKKSGMMANDDISISGGSLHVNGGTNGIKSKGTMHISGGTIWTFSGPKENKSALYSESTFEITGGYIYAIGCAASEPTASASTQKSFYVKLTPSLGAGTAISVALDGAALFDMTPEYAYNAVFVSTPALAEGSTFTLTANGSTLGSGTISGAYTAVAMDT